MVFVCYTLVKLGTLALKTACKRITSLLKKEASFHPRVSKETIDILRDRVFGFDTFFVTGQVPYEWAFEDERCEKYELMLGDVNFPVRAFKSVGGQPIVIDSAKGAHMWDIDGNEYIDYVGLWGPAIIGHADDEVLAALAETMKKGTSSGAPCLLENTLAEMVISVVPSMEMVRFVNSGTEACMGALRLARAFTRNSIKISIDKEEIGSNDE